MGDSTGNIYFSSGSSRIPRPRQLSNSDEQDILPHFLEPALCGSHFHPYLGTSENTQNISVQFMHSCPGQDATQLDSDILHRRPTFHDKRPPLSIASHPIAYPESSQRTTSHALSPYTSDASRFHDFSSGDLSALHIVDAPLRGTPTLRRGSWPSPSQMGYPPWIRSPPTIARSPASEPPESTSDESYQDSDGEEVTRMSPMMNQFQLQSSRNIEPSPHHAHCAQALHPSVMTFQLSETMLQPVDDPENRHLLCSLLDMNIIGDDEPMIPPPSPSSAFSSPSSVSFTGARFQGPSTRPQHHSEKVMGTDQFHMPIPSPNSIPFPSPHSPAGSRPGDLRSSGSKQKKSKMHQCGQCKKMFPRPSGLATHMNSHSGAKPYKCIMANCEKRFAVRSNAKRHLRTHGINPSSSDALSTPRFAVGFEKPMVTQVHDAGKQPSKYRWIFHNPSRENELHRQGSSSSGVDGDLRTGLTFQTSLSSTTSSTMLTGSDDDYDGIGSSSVDDGHQRQRD